MGPKPAPIDFVRRYYADDLADRSSAATKFYLPWLKHIRGKAVLSLGCGPTLFDDAQFFGSAPQRLVGQDLNASNIRFLKRSRHPEVLRGRCFLKKNETAVELVVGNMLDHQPEFKGAFDSIYAMGSTGLHSRRDFRCLLRHVANYLVPGGTFLIIDWAECLLNESEYRKRFEYGWYSKNGLMIGAIPHMLKEAGLSILEHDALDIPNKKIYKWGKVYCFLAKKRIVSG